MASPKNIFFGYSREDTIKIRATINELLNNRDKIDKKIIEDIIKTQLGSHFIKDNKIDINRLLSVLTLPQIDINKKIQEVTKNEN